MTSLTGAMSCMVHIGVGDYVRIRGVGRARALWRCAGSRACTAPPARQSAINVLDFSFDPISSYSSGPYTSVDMEEHPCCLDRCPAG